MVATLRGWFEGGGRGSGGAAAPGGDTLSGVPQPMPAVGGAQAPPHVRLRAALETASRALWRHALGVPEDVTADPEQLQLLRTPLQRVLAGELAERYFPRRPMLMPQLMAAARDPAATATRIADVIAQDPVLVGDVLRLANSAWYRIAQNPVESVQRAVLVCGIDGLQSLAALALMQPLFRGAATRFAKLPLLLWERTTRATLAAELYAQRDCPGERHSAQLLVLLRALGPLAVYRIVEEQLRARPGGVGDAPACAVLLETLGGRAAARVAVEWEISERICSVLAQLDGTAGAQVPDQVQHGLAAAVEVGELLGSASVLIREGVWDSPTGLRIVGDAGMPREWMLSTLMRLGRAA